MASFIACVCLCLHIFFARIDLVLFFCSYFCVKIVHGSVIWIQNLLVGVYGSFRLEIKDLVKCEFDELDPYPINLDGFINSSLHFLSRRQTASIISFHQTAKVHCVLFFMHIYFSYDTCFSSRRKSWYRTCLTCYKCR